MNTAPLINRASVVKVSVAMPDGRVRPSDADLHRLASKAIWEANLLVFDSLVGAVSQIIEYKTWKSFHHECFASYALDATTNGLKVNTNQRLWILQCSMDVYGKHIGEWADVMEKVDAMVRVQLKNEGNTISEFSSKSLEKLAKNLPNVGQIAKITYLPSRNNARDGHLFRLQKAGGPTYDRLVCGKLTLTEILRKNNSKSVRQNDVLSYLRYHWNRATVDERKEFLAWIRRERRP